MSTNNSGDGGEGDNSHTPDEQYHHSFDPANDSISDELIRAVAALNDADPIDLEALSQFIDPEALDALFSSRVNGTPRNTDGEIVFTYDNYTIYIDTDGEMRIRKAD